MTLAEYEELLENIAIGQLTGKTRIPSLEKARKAPGSRRKPGRKDPKMARALKKANAWGRTKSGKMRKGVTQAKIMKKAHALRRKMR